MELSLKNDLVIQCDSCGHVLVIDKDSLDAEVTSYERNMGAEVKYSYEGESYCESCGHVLRYIVRGYEYPVGALNYSDSECSGGHFIQPPSIDVNYFEFDYDACEEEIIDAAVNRAYINIISAMNDESTLHRLSSREFEELVAELFQQQGFMVNLTPETRDGGCDIIATKSIGGLPFMLIIECKKYAAEHPVGVSLVRSLLGVQEDRKANKAVLVTTSQFTKPARAFAGRQQHLISLVDMNDLLEMIRSLR